MQKIGIVIVNYNCEKDVVDCLTSLYKLDVNDLQVTIYIVDNASPRKESADYIESHLFKFQHKNITCLLTRNSLNSGFTGGYNLGANQAVEDKCDYILILNPDTFVHSNFLQILVKDAQSHSKYAAILPKIYFAPGFEFHKDRYTTSEKGKVIWYAGGEMDWQNVIGYSRGVDEVDQGQFDNTTETQIATGCCLLIPRKIIEKIGLFSQKYFMYYEDADWSMRAHNAGYKIGFAPSAVIWHKNATSSGGSGSSLQDYYITRNRLLFGLTYAPFRAKIALIRESLRLLSQGRKWQKQGVRDYYLQRFEQGSYAK